MVEEQQKRPKSWKTVIVVIIIVPAIVASLAIAYFLYNQYKGKDITREAMHITLSFDEENVKHEDRDIMKDAKTSFVPSKKKNPGGKKCVKRQRIESFPAKSYKQIYSYDALKVHNRTKRHKRQKRSFFQKLMNWEMLDSEKPIHSEYILITKEEVRDSEKDGKKIGLRLWDAKMSLEEVRKIQGDAMSRYLDTSVDPCTDFFSYACGNWGKYNPIPPERIGFDTFEQLRERLDIVLKDLLEEGLEKEETTDEIHRQPEVINFGRFQGFNRGYRNLNLRNLDNENAGEDVITIDIKFDSDGNIGTGNKKDAIKKAKDFYRSCMNENILNKRGGKPLIDLLKKLGGWPIIDPQWDETKFDIIGILANLRLYNNDILISQWVGPDIKNSDEYVIQIDQTTLGLPTADCFLDPSNLRYVEAYRVYIIHIATLLGASILNATQDADAIVDFEIKLAMITAPPDYRRNVTEIYNRLTLGELHRLIPQINWYRYMTIVLERPIDMSLPMVVYCVPYLKNLIALLSTTPSRTIANYILWRFVRHRTNNLDRRFDDAKQRFYNVILGREKIPPRWQACISQVNSNLGMALGNLFVNKYFDETSKNDTLLMTKELQESFREILAETAWLDPDTKNLAKSKINAMRLKIGYPDFILDRDELTKRYQDINIHPDFYFENVLSILLHLTRVEQHRIGMGVNKNIWNTAPAVVNAYYSRNKNQIMFPAGILQPPFYHRNFPRALNYGGIGVVIGHEITHGFDDKGRLFDQEGNLQRWWKDSSIEQFHQRSQCLIDQYNSFIIPEINEPVDGVNTQGENIADNGGIKQAFHAYQHWLQSNPEADELLPGLNMTNVQLFFLNFAQVWCGSIRPEAAKNKLKTAVHAPGRFRVIGTLSNSQDFAKVFNCPIGSPMNPKDKCCIW